MAESANHAVRMLCRVLKVSRSAFYAWRSEPTRRERSDSDLAVHIKGIHRESRGTYGSPRITMALRKEGIHVNRKRVTRLMREQDVRGIPSRRFRGTTTDSAHDKVVAPELLERDFTAAGPNEVWVGDITYLRVGTGWAYLAVLIDLFSRRVVGWSLESHMRTELAANALRQALVVRQPAAGLIHHTDRGVQYASDAYTALLANADIVQSMSRKGNCWDNAVSESFFGTLKQELVKGRPWYTLMQARTAIGNYIHQFYNHQRLHSTIGYCSPVQFESNQRALEREAA